ncbi:MAG: helicase [Oscillospiraceae bacterium]|jgi:hypothetical protein|nr:helicase [Oscillospiraceae bacterium]
MTALPARLSPFHTYYTARRLASLADDALLPAFSSSDIAVYPYQIAAAQFALRSSHQRGVILCDEGSLGKTYEALIVAAQKWYEGKDRQFIVLPTNLLRQWQDKLENAFTLPFIVIDSEDALQSSGGFDQPSVVLTTYDFAVSHADEIVQIPWDLVIFDEASILAKSYTGENKTANALKAAAASAFKLLLTPTPITMSIMDIYGLVHFIDESVLPDSDAFYKRYFRKPENYSELTGWVCRYAFRTLKNQVTDYVGFTERLPYTVGYTLTDAEKVLYDKTARYLALPRKFAYPKMEPYELSLMFYHTLSSSPQAFVKTLDGAISRLEDGGEKDLLLDMQAITKAVPVNGKMAELLTILKKCFAKLSKLKLPQKTLIFTDNRTTQTVLHDLLAEHSYGALAYSGANSRDFSVMERFRTDNSIQILIATDEAARGLDIEFCPVVVNYDLLYNAVELEQRISRCHRQGQQSDVLAISLLSGENLSDVRILELINKRTLQFDGIFGMSDAIVGNFDADLDEVLDGIRPPQTVRTGFAENLTAHEDANRQTVSAAEDTLFTTFTKSVAERVTVTPQYIADKSAEINAKLWAVTKAFFEDFNIRNDDTFRIDEVTQTVTCTADEPPHLFYYWTNSGNKPYKSLRTYGMAKDFKPHHGRITLTSVLARGMLGNVACTDSGTLTVSCIKPCRIGFYKAAVDDKSGAVRYNILTGQTDDGRILSDEECRAILELPVADFTESGKRTEYWLRESTGARSPDALDKLVSAEDCKRRYLEEHGSGRADQIEHIKLRAEQAKTRLERDLAGIRADHAAAEKQTADVTDRIAQMKAQKQIAALRQELRRKEEGLFFERMRIDSAAEAEIAGLTDSKNLKIEISRQFLIEIKSEGTHNG